MDGQPARPQSRQLWWIAGIWTAIALFTASQTVFVMRAQGMHHAWVKLFFALSLAWLPWALGTPLVIRLGRKYPPSAWTKLSTWGAHLAACTSVGLVYSGWSVALNVLLNPYGNAGSGRFLPAWVHAFNSGILEHVICYGVILLAGQAADARDRLVLKEMETARLNEQLSKVQLDDLRRQIEPHFLFNSLNAITGLIRENRNEDAVSTIVGLSDFLRRVVNDSRRQEVPLSEELDYAQKYLEIQKVRFAERLQVSVNVPADLLPLQVPSLILQPMVENAIKHGISQRVKGGGIRISAESFDGTIRISVSNDGPGLPSGWERDHCGVGISNVRTRLRGLYGAQFDLTIRNQPGGVIAEVMVPVRLAELKSEN